MNKENKMKAGIVGVADSSMGLRVCSPPAPPWLLPESDVDILLLDWINKGVGDPLTLVKDHLKRKTGRFTRMESTCPMYQSSLQSLWP